MVQTRAVKWVATLLEEDHVGLLCTYQSLTLRSLQLCRDDRHAPVRRLSPANGDRAKVTRSPFPALEGHTITPRLPSGLPPSIEVDTQLTYPMTDVDLIPLMVTPDVPATSPDFNIVCECYNYTTLSICVPRI